MSQKYLIRIAELESQLRQKDQQLSLVEETEAFLRSALARAEEKIEEDERAEALLKQRGQDSDRSTRQAATVLPCENGTD